MSNTQLRAASALSAFLGVILVIGNSFTILHAALTGQGSTVLEQKTAEATVIHGAASNIATIITNAQTQLFIGMLLIILGLLLYMLAHVRESAQRVRVRAVPSRHSEIEAMRMKRRGPTFFWMEIKI